MGVLRDGAIALQHDAWVVYGILEQMLRDCKATKRLVKEPRERPARGTDREYPIFLFDFEPWGENPYYPKDDPRRYHPDYYGKYRGRNDR